MRRALRNGCGFLLWMTAGWAASFARAEVIFETSGTQDPLVAGAALGLDLDDPGGTSVNGSSGDNTGWQMRKASGRDNYQFSLSPAATGDSTGWTATFTVRASNAGNSNNQQTHLEVSNATDSWLLALMGNGPAGPGLYDWDTNYNSGVGNLVKPLDPTIYHTIQMVYSAATGRATYYVEGLSTGVSQGAEDVPLDGPNRLVFGSNTFRSQAIDETWSSVKFETVHDVVSTKSSPDVVIYRGTYPGWPWITSTPSGKLITVWREGTVHDFSASGKVMMSESIDHGKTWTNAVTIQDQPEVDDRNAAIVALSNSEWIVSYNTYTSSLVSQAMTIRTNDGGQTWSEPTPVSNLDARTRAAPVQLSDGKLILPFYLAPGNQSLAAISSDNGISWTVSSIPNTPSFVGDEWSIVQMPDDHLVGIMRNSAPTADGTLYMAQSFDEGLTWSKPVATNLRDTRLQSPPQIFLQNGRPWVLYDDARMVSVVLATTNDPSFVTWDIENRVEAYQYRADGNPIQDGGYPSSVDLGNGKRLIVDYLIDGDHHQIVGYFAQVPEPSSIALLAFGSSLAMVGAYCRRRVPSMQFVSS